MHLLSIAPDASTQLLDVDVSTLQPVPQHLSFTTVCTALNLDSANHAEDTFFIGDVAAAASDRLDDVCALTMIMLERNTVFISIVYDRRAQRTANAYFNQGTPWLKGSVIVYMYAESNDGTRTHASLRTCFPDAVAHNTFVRLMRVQNERRQTACSIAQFELRNNVHVDETQRAVITLYNDWSREDKTDMESLLYSWTVRTLDLTLHDEAYAAAVLNDVALHNI